MSKARTTSSAIVQNLPHFPYTAAPAAPSPASALHSSHHFVTTLVSPSPTAPARIPDFCSDPPAQEPTDFVSASASPALSSPSPSHSSAPPPPLLLASIEVSLEQNARRPAHSHSCNQSASRAKDFASRRPSSSSLLLRRFQKSKPSASSLPVVPQPLPDPPLTAQVQDRKSVATKHRRRSSWRRFRMMGNGITSPFRSMGLCITGGFGVVAFCDNRSASSSSSGSSICTSGEYAPEFVRAVVESNVLLSYRASE